MSDRVRSFLTESVRAGLFPGASYSFGSRDRVWTGSVGMLGYGDEWPAVDEGTRFDLASLTKVVATTPVAHRLWLDSALKLDAKVSDVLPEFRHREVTVEHLLRHESGLPAYNDLARTCGTPAEVWSALTALELERAPGEATVYSCIGFIVLQRLLERLTGRSLDKLADESVFGRLAMSQTSFGPLAGAVDDVAPTGRLEPWHGSGRGWLQGKVHDPLAYLQGGVSGNAGLFGTSNDLAKYCQSVLSDENSWQEWVAREADHERGLGWDIKSEQGSSAGATMSLASFGHTGFTGTSIWIDPVAGVFAVLLTNAVHPLGGRTDLRDVRSRYCDLVISAFGD